MTLDLDAIAALVWQVENHDNAECFCTKPERCLLHRLADGTTALLTEVRRLRKALDEALDEWAYASQYKGDYLAAKHRDAERIAEFRALTPEPPHA
jgi:hypothetical protein